MLVQDNVVQEQVQRILNSDTLRNAQVLRQLLRFLAEKSIAGDTDNLKEYTIGLDALGKPASYDPKHDSVVRIQIGRLRYKLLEYYRTEGKNDPIVIDLPKGHFRITWENRTATSPEPALAAISVFPQVAQPIVIPQVQELKKQIRLGYFGLAIIVIWALSASVLAVNQYRANAPLREAWTPELKELWEPFITSNRPTILSVGSPLFINLQGIGSFRDLALNKWDDVVASPHIQSMRKAFGNPVIAPRYIYTGVGEMTSAFQLGKLLDVGPMKISLMRSSEISWQQMVDDNILFIGPPRVFGDILQQSPVEEDFSNTEDGIRDQKPDSGHPAFYPDTYSSLAAYGAAGWPEDGEIYALVSRTPGPLGTGAVMAFNSNHSPGILGAVQWFTNPAFARELVLKMRKPSGEIPKYVQLVLKVKYHDSVPTQISYITHREIRK